MFLAYYNYILYNKLYKKINLNKDNNINKIYTYKFLPLDKKYNIEYLELYLEGKKDLIPNNISTKIKHLKTKFLLQRKSFQQSQVDFNSFEYKDYIPDFLIRELLDLQFELMEFIKTNIDKPKNYDHYVQMCFLLEDIRSRKIKHNVSICRDKKYIDYNLFGTKTGRLTCKKNSFPILNLRKDLRSNIYPINDYFLEMDFNAFDPRVILALNGIPQPTGDLHDYNSNLINISSADRDKVKSLLFKHLYGNSQTENKLTEFYSKDNIIKNYYINNKIINLFGREIICNKDDCFPLIIQSTASDLFTRQALRVYDNLKGKKTFISMLIHDSLVLDLSKEDMDLVPMLLKIFKSTELGVFPATFTLGTNLGNGKKL